MIGAINARAPWWISVECTPIYEFVLERPDGVDFSLRHSSSRLRAEANLYYYSLSNFVFLAPVLGPDGAIVILARDQDRVFIAETRTAGYTVVNLL